MKEYISKGSWYRRPPLLIAVITGLSILGDSMLYIVLPTHWQEAGLDSLWEVGILLAVNRLIRVPAMPVIRRIYGAVSPRPVIFVMTLAAAVSTFGYAWAYGFWEWLAVRCLWGLSYAFLRLGGFFLVVKSADQENRGFAMGEYDGIFHMGRLVSMLMGGYMADSEGLAQTALIFGFLSLGAPVLTAWKNPIPFPRLVDASRFEEDERVWKTVRHDRLFLRCLLLGFLLNVLFQGIFTSSLSHLAETSYGDMITLGGWVVGAATLSGTIQSLRWAWEPFLSPVAGQFTGGERRIPAIAVSLAVCAAAFVCITFRLPLGMWIVLTLIIQMSATVLETLADAAAGDLAASYQSKTALMSRYAMFSDFGAGVGPLSAYLLMGFLSADSACWLSAFILAFLYLPYRSQMAGYIKKHRF